MPDTVIDCRACGTASQEESCPHCGLNLCKRCEHILVTACFYKCDACRVHRPQEEREECNCTELAIRASREECGGAHQGDWEFHDMGEMGIYHCPQNPQHAK